MTYEKFSAIENQEMIDFLLHSRKVSPESLRMLFRNFMFKTNDIDSAIKRLSILLTMEEDDLRVALKDEIEKVSQTPSNRTN